MTTFVDALEREKLGDRNQYDARPDMAYFTLRGEPYVGPYHSHFTSRGRRWYTGIRHSTYSEKLGRHDVPVEYSEDEREHVDNLPRLPRDPRTVDSVFAPAPSIEDIQLDPAYPPELRQITLPGRRPPFSAVREPLSSMIMPTRDFQAPRPMSQAMAATMAAPPPAATMPVGALAQPLQPAASSTTAPLAPQAAGGPAPLQPSSLIQPMRMVAASPTRSRTPSTPVQPPQPITPSTPWIGLTPGASGSGGISKSPLDEKVGTLMGQSALAKLAETRVAVMNAYNNRTTPVKQAHKQIAETYGVSAASVKTFIRDN